jgi:thiamine biosynthesis lipoprotein
MLPRRLSVLAAPALVTAWAVPALAAWAVPALAAWAVPALAAWAVASVADAGSARRSRVLMGTTCTVDAEAATDEVAAAAAVAALDEVARLERVLSTWDPAAEMSLANAAASAGEARVSRELADSLSYALEQSRRTRGAFDPVIGALVDAWDLRGSGREPSRQELAAALRATGHELVTLDARAGSLRLAQPAAWIDTGGFGKGVALDAAAGAASRAGATAALLDFGGQLLAMGASDGTGSGVAVADPRERSRPVLELALRQGSASTSAQSERFVEVGGRRFGHVLDPRSGRPLAFDGSATVVAGTAAEADVLSTALLVMGPAAGLRFARRESLCAGFLVPDPRGGGLRLRATESFLSLVTSAAPDVSVRGPASSTSLRSSRR